MSMLVVPEITPEALCTTLWDTKNHRSFDKDFLSLQQNKFIGPALCDIADLVPFHCFHATKLHLHPLGIFKDQIFPSGKARQKKITDAILSCPQGDPDIPNSFRCKNDPGNFLPYRIVYAPVRRSCFGIFLFLITVMRSFPCRAFLLSGLQSLILCKRYFLFLTLGIPGDGTVAIMLSALMINGLNPGLSLFTTQGDIMYAIMLGLILVNIFMLLQGKFLTTLFAKVVSIPQEILTPIIVIFCFAGAYSVNENYFDVGIALIFGMLAWVLRKLELPPVPILLGLVLGSMTETNFRRALLISNGSPKIFFSSVYCIIFLVLILLAVGAIVRGKMKERNAQKEA